MAKNSSPNRLAGARISGLVAAVVGLVLVFTYVVPGIQAGPAPEAVGMLAFIGGVGLLSIFGAVGYWLGKRWGWYVHLVSTLGQLAFPGVLFELKPDPYHLIAWASPVISLIVILIMRGAARRVKEPAAPPPGADNVFSSPLDPLSPISRGEKKK